MYQVLYYVDGTQMGNTQISPGMNGQLTSHVNNENSSVNKTVSLGEEDLTYGGFRLSHMKQRKRLLIAA
jgi:hypothetical protein